MIAEVHISPADRLALERDSAVHEVLRLTTEAAGLEGNVESDIHRAARKLIDPILQLADDVVAAQAELQGIERRLTAHWPTCPTCQPGGTCWTYHELQARRDDLQARCDRAMLALLGGRRR